MSRGAWIEALLFLAALLGFLASVDWAAAHRGGFDPEQRAEGTVRVVTWNVGRPAGGGGASLADEALEHVASVLAELEPDLVCLQEVASSRQLDALIARLPGSWRWSCEGPPGGRVAFLSPGRDLEGRGGIGSLRRALRAEFEAGGRRFVAVGLHAHPWSAEERNEELGLAVDTLRGAPGPPGRFLLGDLNLDLDLDKRRDLFSDDSHLDVESYNYAALHLVDATEGTGPTAAPDRRLDYVFLAPGTLEIVQAGPLRGRRAGGMDHDPVVVDALPR